MSSDLSQPNNNEEDQITVHKPGTANIKEQALTKEDMQARRKDRMVIDYFNFQIFLNKYLKLKIKVNLIKKGCFFYSRNSRLYCS